MYVFIKYMHLVGCWAHVRLCAMVAIALGPINMFHVYWAVVRLKQLGLHTLPDAQRRALANIN